ncbi:MAG TPA: START domain-containing protein, partial [Rheinheimera sp.]|nr:START domain-containing protein [Rheinheimera sp.]
MLSLVTLPCSADSADWQSYKSSESTQVEYRKSQDGLLQIRAKTTVKSGIGAMLHLLEDTANITNWVANSQKAELTTKPDNKTHIVHTYFSAIWPVSKRDMVTKSVWQQNPQSHILTMTITDIGQNYPLVKGYVRIQQVEGEWTLTPLADGMLTIQYQGQADPGGKLPVFIAEK